LKYTASLFRSTTMHNSDIVNKMQPTKLTRWF
jgi:hypothetical protein